MRALGTAVIFLVGLAAAFMAFAHFLSVRSAQDLMAGGAQAEGTVTAQHGAKGSNAKFWGNRLFYPLVAAGLLAWGIARSVRRRKPT